MDPYHGPIECNVRRAHRNRETERASARHRRTANSERRNDLLAHRSHGSARLFNSFINISTNNYRPSSTQTQHGHALAYANTLTHTFSCAKSVVYCLVSMGSRTTRAMTRELIVHLFILLSAVGFVCVYLSTHLACARIVWTLDVAIHLTRVRIIRVIL